MSAHDAYRRPVGTNALALPALADRTTPHSSVWVLLVIWSTRIRATESENRSLARRVHELTIAQDDLLDAAAAHSLCEHEERVIGLVRFYDRPPRRSPDVLINSSSPNAGVYRQVSACNGQTCSMPAAV